jgi:serine/threonine-protein kinase HipA
VGEDLAVWLYGQRVATVTESRGRPRLTYTDDAVGRHPLGSPLLSITLPVQPERHAPGVVRAFLDGLLPEGQARLAAANRVDVRASDTVALIRALGRDCAGAVVIQPAAEAPPPPPSTLRARRLTDEDVEELVANLRTAPLGIGEKVRVSLGGVQEKLLLTRMPDGSWGSPVDGSPSTHILKPEIARFPATVENEAFCMRVASHLGLHVARVATTVIRGRTLLVVERFDRVVHDDGSVERIHQEDFCQATGTPPATKYEEDGGPSLRKVANILASAASPGALKTLLQATVCNVLLGNGDAHGKNLSLLHHASGRLELSPLYDLLSTLHYRQDRLAMRIDTVQRLERVTAERLVNEAVRWGLSPDVAREIITDVVDRAPEAVAAARDETEGLPPEIPAVVTMQLARLRAGARVP